MKIWNSSCWSTKQPTTEKHTKCTDQWDWSSSSCGADGRGCRACCEIEPETSVCGTVGPGSPPVSWWVGVWTSETINTKWLPDINTKWLSDSWILALNDDVANYSTVHVRHRHVHSSLRVHLWSIISVKFKVKVVQEGQLDSFRYFLCFDYVTVCTFLQS